jgi:hypothetical protein
MANIRDFMVTVNCDELIEKRDPDPMKPLVTYFENGWPLTPLLQRWLVKLLKAEKTQRHYLSVKTRRGRPRNSKFERDNFVGERVAELEGTIITNALCEKLLAITGMAVAEPDATSPGTRRFGWHERDNLGDWVPVSLTLKIGKTLTSLQVQKAAAAESGVSVSTVKRVLAARDQALTASD